MTTTTEVADLLERVDNIINRLDEICDHMDGFSSAEEAWLSSITETLRTWRYVMQETYESPEVSSDIQNWSRQRACDLARFDFAAQPSIDPKQCCGLPVTSQRCRSLPAQCLANWFDHSLTTVAAYARHSFDKSFRTTLSAFRFYVLHNDWVAVASLAVIVGAPVVVHHHRMVDAMLRARGKGKQGEVKGTRKFFLQQKTRRQGAGGLYALARCARGGNQKCRLRPARTMLVLNVTLSTLIWVCVPRFTYMYSTLALR